MVGVEVGTNEEVCIEVSTGALEETALLPGLDVLTETTVAGTNLISIFAPHHTNIKTL